MSRDVKALFATEVNLNKSIRGQGLGTRENNCFLNSFMSVYKASLALSLHEEYCHAQFMAGISQIGLR